MRDEEHFLCVESAWNTDIQADSVYSSLSSPVLHAAWHEEWKEDSVGWECS